MKKNGGNGDTTKRRLAALAKEELAGRTGRLPGQFARYIASGAAAWLVDIIVFYLVYRFAPLDCFGDRRHFAAKVVSFLAANLTNYLICCFWVFSSRSSRNAAVSYGMFLLIGLGGLCIASAVLFAGVDVLGFYAPFVNIATPFFTIPWNFTIRKIALFRNRPQSGTC